MITAHFTVTDKPRGAQDNSLSPRLARDFETIDELQHFLAYNRAHIVNLEFSGSFDFATDLEEN